MNRIIAISVLALWAGFLFAQEPAEPAALQALELQSGEVKCGTIVFQSADVVVIETATGEKFQYPMAEIKHMREATEADLQQTTALPIEEPQAPGFGIMAAVQGGICGIPQQSAGGFLDIRLIPGFRNLFQENIFLGAGVGYTQIFNDLVPERFIPLFLHMNTNFRKQRFSPDFSLGAGYMFNVGGNLESGFFAEMSAGCRYRINYRVALHIGAFFRMQQTKAEVEQIIEGGIYGYESNAAIYGGGIRAALSF